ncbi:MAG: hypothetical protein EHM55_07605 [Acidobacteria bacterium]|nr:MAG: hypothetical protein EHM55_07605 [Acidobacteriota bacterium]
MVPVVRRHEERAAMFRIVVAVRSWRVARDHRLAIGARSGLELSDLTIARAGERQRGGLLHEVARADAASARRGLFDDRVHRAGVHRNEAHRLQIHAADAARALFVFEYIRVHGAGPRDSRKLGGGARGDEKYGQQCGECPGFHCISRKCSKPAGPAAWGWPTRSKIGEYGYNDVNNKLTVLPGRTATVRPSSETIWRRCHGND